MGFIGNVLYCIMGFFLYQWLFAGDVDLSLCVIFTFLLINHINCDLANMKINYKLDKIMKGK